MPRPRRRRESVQTIQIPAGYVEMADRRLYDILQRCIHDRNIVESVSRSCYLQGLIDGLVLAGHDPALIEAMKEKR